MQSQSPIPSSQCRKLTLIDGSGYIFRAYHALPSFSDPSGTPVGAVYGFVSMLLKLIDSTTTDCIAVVFDAGRQTFRNRMYEAYKQNRPEPPADLIPQFKLVRDATDALGLARVESADFEADDIIAAYAKVGRENGYEVQIISSDKDLMQLIGEGVSMFDPMKQKPIGPEQVQEKFGVGPERVQDVLALIGDSSDNIPGVPGIGPKTAAELIQHFGNLETLLSRAGEIPQAKRRETIQTHAEAARLSYALIALDADAPLPLPIDALAQKKPDPAALAEFLIRHGFNSLLTRIKNKYSIEINTAPPPPVPTAEHIPVTVAYRLIQDVATLGAWIQEAKIAGHIAISLQASLPDANQAELIGLGLSISSGSAAYVPLGHSAGEAGALFTAPAAGQLPLKEALTQLKPLLEDPGILKIGHNSKYDSGIFARNGIRLQPIADVMLMSYVLGAGNGNHTLEDLAERCLKLTLPTTDSITGTGKARLAFAHVAPTACCDFAAQRADVIRQSYSLLLQQLFAAHKITIYETLERPLVPVLAAMEARGVKVDAVVLDHLSQDFAVRMQALEEEIHRLAGHSFNVGSPKQLGEVLFEEQGIPGGKKSSKTGAYSTDSQVLEELAEQGYPMPVKVLEWRQLAKLRSTYTDALKTQINPRTGRVHTSYAMAATTTGRLSSTDPNLQNIPIRTAEGRKIREAFVAEPGNILLSADYSQIELRLLAHIADIAPLKAAFAQGADIHAITASQMFGIPVAEIGADLRRSAKTINFGIIYGISAHGLAVRLGISRAEAAQYIDRYFQQYPGIRDYMETTKRFAREHGYVETLFGRRCYIPGITDSNVSRRQFAERQAINAPLQGTAADVIKRAMIRWEAQTSPLANLLLQVHDELVFEAPAMQANEAVARIKTIMEQAGNFTVPLTVEIGIGNNWGACH